MTVRKESTRQEQNNNDYKDDSPALDLLVVFCDRVIMDGVEGDARACFLPRFFGIAGEDTGGCVSLSV
jgi:hypothetical protein